ncbi:glycosyltransferase family 9 protein [Taibaiella helva]|uniref:glycosyltransferase family 9 protein n=1 Tax=Taibaiella helva TaxID=2301235 RepID=UPI000E56AE88|nr:glycosyltransferase family 9 protein [Taibaiella helva]
MNLKQKQFLDTYIGLPLVYLHIALARLLGFILRRNHHVEQAPNEICIIKLLGFGSVIMASDALYSLKVKYPDARLTIICSKSIEEGIRSIRLFETVYVIDDRNFFRLVCSSLATVARLQRRRRLWIADLEVYSKLTGILSAWTLALNRFGFYFNQVPFRYNLYTHHVYFNTVINVEDNYEEMVRAMGVTAITPYTIKGFPPRQQGKAYTYIALNNTCSELARERRLTDAQLQALCSELLRLTPYKIALLGAPSDREANEQFLDSHNFDRAQITNIAGQYEFEAYYRFLYEECALMVTIDSAPLHIANKLNIPNLSIWGPTSPQSRIDLNTANEYLYLGVNCSPCAHFVDKLPCGGDNFCIKNITTAPIINKIQKLLLLYSGHDTDKTFL